MISLKSALLHPIPSSRRHVIRVDISVLVDVIRVEFWMEVFIKKRRISLTGKDTRGKFKILMEAI